MQSDLIIEVAESLVGTPWQFQGRVPGVGLDCAGVLWHINSQLPHPQVNTVGNAYTPSLRGDAFIKVLSTFMDQVSAPLPGDVLVFSIRKERAQHLAVLCNENKIIHATLNNGVVKTTFDSRWSARTVAFFRFRIGD